MMDEKFTSALASALTRMGGGKEAVGILEQRIRELACVVYELSGFPLSANGIQITESWGQIHIEKKGAFRGYLSSLLEYKPVEEIATLLLDVVTAIAERCEQVRALADALERALQDERVLAERAMRRLSS